MRAADEALSGYQRRIGSLDMPAWEQSVERRRDARGFGLAPRKSAKLDTNLIDLDLIRGSTFAKGKPQQGLWSVVRQGVQRALLFPLYRSWWRHHLGTPVYRLLCLVYVVYLTTVALYLAAEHRPTEMPSVTLVELVTPGIIALALSVVKSQIVTFRETYPSKTRVSSRIGAVPSTISTRRTSQASSSLNSTISEANSDSPSHEDLRPSHPLARRSPAAPDNDDDGAVFCSSPQRRRSPPGLSTAVLENTVVAAPSTSSRMSLLLPFSSDAGGRMTPGRRSQSFCSYRRAATPLPTRSASVNGGSVAALAAAVNNAAPSISTAYQVPSISAQSYPRNRTCLSHGRRHSDRRRTRAAKIVRIAGSSGAEMRWHTDSSDPELSDPPSGLSRIRRAPPRTSGFVTDSSERPDSGLECHAANYAKAPLHVANYAKTSGSDSDASYGSEGSVTSGHLDPSSSGCPWDNPLQTTNAATDLTGCTIWEGSEMKKVDLSTLDICAVVVSRVDAQPQSTDYFIFGSVMSVLLSLLPAMCRLMLCTWSTRSCLPQTVDTLSVTSLLLFVYRVPGWLADMFQSSLGTSVRERVIAVGCMGSCLVLTSLLFFLLSVVERSFKQRLLFAKYFCYLTSARRARKFDLPHFRLKKVRNIKTWLSVRSCLKKTGPQRSVDMVASVACLVTVGLVTCLCVELLEDADAPHIDFYRTQLLVWCFALGVFLVRIMTLGSHINSKYRNLSVMLTEQINLYLHIERKPHKKESLILANNVLKLASDLLKELERPFTILGFSANPFLYNVTKLLVLSACSGVLSDMFGFKLKLYKIKLM